LTLKPSNGWDDVEGLYKLLFELSSAERMNIMLEFQSHRMKLSDISRKLDFTVTEASRHLQRLGDAKLIIKGSDGLYGLTPYGELALSQLAGLGFVEKYREYFLEYDVSRLPYEFVSRIGELNEGKIMTDTFSTIEETGRILRDAKKFIWILSDKNLPLLTPILVNKLKSPFEVKVIFPKEEFPKDSEAIMPSTTPGLHERVLPTVEIRVVVTDQHAGFSLPLRSNRLSYRAFKGNHPKFHKWCKDLFSYYWEMAKPITS
jgi:predicted transcriptional regulator